MSIDSASEARGVRVDPTLAFHRVMILLVILTDIGAIIDAWSHIHEGFEIESFFTPNHYLLFGGSIFIGLLVSAFATRSIRQGKQWLNWLPPGYNATAVGVVVFGMGGGFDIVWHELFGFEANLQAPVSPSHLLLIAGVALMDLGVLLHILHRRESAPRRFEVSTRAGLSLVFGVAILTVQVFWPLWYFDPLTADYASGGAIMGEKDAYSYVEYGGPTAEIAGFSGILLLSIGWILFLLLPLHRWRPPVGSATLIVAYGSVLRAIAAGTYVFLPAILAAGIAVDVIWAWMRRGGDARLSAPLGYNIIALVFPLTLLSSYMIIVETQLGGIVWPVVIWSGSIAFSMAYSFIISIVITGSPFPKRWLWGTRE